MRRNTEWKRGHFGPARGEIRDTRGALVAQVFGRHGPLVEVAPNLLGALERLVSAAQLIRAQGAQSTPSARKAFDQAIEDAETLAQETRQEWEEV